jgi:Zn-dependent protease
MGNTIRLGRLFGIEFRLHFTWFIVFFLVTGLLVEPDFDDGIAWLTGISASLLFFISVLAHELAHSLVGRAYGVEISGITLFLFGGIAGMKGDVKEPGTEFKMAIAGPLCSLALGGIFALILLIPAVQGRAAMMIIWLALMNGMLAVFNLLPGFPLDGGRVFRSVLWRSTGNYLLASRIATRVGQGFGFLLIIGGIVTAIFNLWGLSWFDGIWIAFIGWFLSSAASAGYRDILRKTHPPAAADNDITAAEYTVINPDSEKKE